MKSIPLEKIKKQHIYLLTGILLFVMGLIYYFPRFLMDGIPHYINEDTYFHLNRIVGLRNAFESPVNFLNFAHNGPMVNNFYPWLTMYPMYLLYKLTNSYVLAYKIFYLLLTLINLYIGYYVMYRIAGNHLSAFVFTILYTYSAYRFINIFRRADLGESIMMTELLIVFWGLYHVTFGDCKKWGWLSIGMTLIAYSHNLSLALSSFMIGFHVLLSFFFWNKKRERMLSLLKATITAVLVSLGSFVSIFYYMNKNDLYTPGGSGRCLQDSAFSPGEIIENSLKNVPVPYAAGFWVVLALTGVILFYLNSAITKDRFKRNRCIDCFAFSGTVLFFAVSSILPWEQIGDHTCLSRIQFIWRLNSYTTLFLTASFSYYLSYYLKSTKFRIIICILVCIAAVSLHYSAILSLHREENARIFEQDIAGGDAVTFDYASMQAKQYRNTHGYDMDDTYINGKALQIKNMISKNGSLITYTVRIPEPSDVSSEIDLPVFWYNTQKCIVNGEPVRTYMSERGGTVLKVEPGENVISIYYHHTILTYLSWAFSAVILTLLICFHIRSYKKPEFPHF